TTKSSKHILRSPVQVIVNGIYNLLPHNHLSPTRFFSQPPVHIERRIFSLSAICSLIFQRFVKPGESDYRTQSDAIRPNFSHMFDPCSTLLSLVKAKKSHRHIRLPGKL